MFRRCAPLIPVGGFGGPRVFGVAGVEELEGGSGIVAGVGVSAAEVSGTDDIVEGFGDARIVGIRFGESKDFGSEPIGSGVEFSRGRPFGFGGLLFGIGQEIGRVGFFVGVETEEGPIDARVHGKIIAPAFVGCRRREGTPPIVVEAVQMAWGRFAADAGGDVGMEFGAMKD